MRNQSILVLLVALMSGLLSASSLLAQTVSIDSKIVIIDRFGNETDDDRSSNGNVTAAKKLSAVISPDPAGYTYQWYRNGSSISGATNAIFYAVDEGTYEVRATNGGTITNSVGLFSTVSDQTEYEALIALHSNIEALQSLNWNVSLNPSTVTFTDFEDFDNISVVAGDIVRLNLPLNANDNAIPTELGDLSEIVLLSLFANTGGDGNLENSVILPNSIENLSSLRYFMAQELYMNYLPSTFWNLSNLETLDVTYNYYSYSRQEEGLLSIPSAIGNMTSLKHIQIWAQELTDLPSSMSNLTNLEYLALASNELEFDDLEKLYASPGVTHFPNISYLYVINQRGSREYDIVEAGDTYVKDALIGGSANSYQWYRNNSSYQSGRVLTIPNVSTSHTGYYSNRVTSSIVTGGSGNQYINAHFTRLAVLDFPSGSCIAASQPSVQAELVGDIGNGGSIEWFTSPTAPNPVHTGSTFDISTAGTYYVEITYDWYGDQIKSDRYEFTIYDFVDPIISTSDPTEFCAEGPVSANLFLANHPSYNSYQWYKDGTPINGATSTSYVATDFGTYTVDVTDDRCTITSNSLVIGTRVADVVADAGEDITTCASSATLRGSGSGPGVWTQISGPGTANIVSPNNNVSSVIINDFGTYVFQFEVTDSDACGIQVASDQVQVTRADYQVVISQEPLCDTDQFTLRATVIPADPGFTFQWLDQDGYHIVGETSSTFTTNVLGEYGIRARYEFCTIYADPITVNSLVPDDIEYEALKAFYLSLDGDNWNHNNGWDMTLDPSTVTSADLANFFGVTVADGDVTEIRLVVEGLTGDIPSQLADLCRLRRLTLYNNSISGLPDEIGDLPRLNYLNMHTNPITSLPTGIGNSTSLGTINFNNCDLQSIPSSIGNISSLQYLLLGNNNLTSVPSQLSLLSSMNSLTLNGNQLTSLPASFNSFASINTFSVTSNQLTNLPLTNVDIDRLQSGSNQLDFGDYEPYYDGPDSRINNYSQFLFSPQNTIVGSKQNILIEEGSDFLLSFSTPGVHNLYQWQKDDGGIWLNVGSQQTTTPYQTLGATSADAGIYRAEVTNEWVVGLTIPSYEHFIHVLSGVNEICLGSATKTITGPGAGNAVWYDASNSVVANGSTLNTSIPGNYSVEVSYDGLTSSRVYFTIYQLAVSAGADQVICDPGTDITASGNFVNGSWSVVSGPGSVTFSDETAASTSITLNQTDYGIYVLRFTGNGECEVTQDDVEINYDPNYAADINFTFSSGYEDNGTFYSCPGSSITIHGSMSPGNLNNWRYDWTRDGAAWLTTFGNSTSQVATSLTEDTDFGVTISRRGCSRDADVKTVTMNHFADAITIAVEDNDPIFCPTDTRTLTVPSGYQGYQWRRDGVNLLNGTNNTYVASLEGSYDVVITDNTSCSDITASVDLSYEEITSVTVDNTQPTTCDLTLDGLADFRIQWPSGIGSASYEVFTSGGLLVTSGTAVTNELVTVTGLGRGTYRIVSLHPDTQCPTTRNFTIQYGGPVANICATPVSCSAVYPDVSQTSDVSFTVSRLQPSPTGTYNYEIVGTNGYSYEGSGSFGTLVSGVPVLTYDQEYTLLIKDEGDNTCGRSYPIEIENANIALSTDQPGNDIVVCEAGETVDVGINASLSRSTCGATPTDFFTINWTKDGVSQTPLTGQTSPVTLPTLGLGSYEVTVTSEETGYTDCTESLSFTITQSDLNATANTTDVSCPGGSNGRAWGLVTGGYPPYSYEWIEVGTGATVSNFAIAGGLSAGDYQLQVSDSRCTSPFTVDVTINEPDPIGTVAFTLPTVSSCVVESYITDPGGTAPYTFTWSKSVQTYVTSVLGDGTVETVPGAIVEEVMFTDPNLTIVAGEVRSTSSTTEVLPGTYIITVRDANGCEIQSAEQEIEQPPVVRDYKICFRWKTRAQEDDEVEAPPFVFDNQGIASSAMGQELRESSASCVEDAVAAFTGSFEQLCLSGDYLNDEVSLKYDINQYHYTLYYYDRAGNLNRTIPPKGVNFLTDASQRRDNTPSHTLVTEYDYDNWGQLTRQLSPDGGESHFAYNNQGQLRFSQNAKQLANNTFSYTKYDRLSRIIEVGQAEQGTVYTAPDANTYPNTTFTDLQSEDLLDLDKQNMAQTEQFPTTDHNPAQQTKTFYTELSGEQYYGNQDQDFLRNRVSYTEITNKDGSVASSHYSYDPHGNVKWLIQNIPGVDRHYIGYDYDLINGNVKQVKLNEGSTAPYYHRYSYDEDNRLIETETSDNPFIWETDAEYDYYAHGPLRRTELGEDKVQGLDYAYTIHGWLKGINHPSLTNMDIGGDSFNNQVAKDAFGMTLNYYEGDFQNNGSPFEPTNSYHLEAKTGGPDRNLYNGNISAWSSRVLNPSASVMQYDQTIGWQYEYDELNRIKSSSFSSHDGTSWTASNDYGTDYTYDPNGNLMSLNRKAYGANDTERAMDELTYHYNPANNQLEYVDDAITSSSWLSDIEDQSAGNYTYDEIGNLINDVQEGTTMDWNMYGKVNQILHGNGDLVTFSYDANGNRIRKNQIKGTETKDTYYVRDPSGAVVAIFEGDGTTQSVKEIPLYGSSRLGQYRPSIQVIESVDGTEELVAYTGVSYLVEETTDALILQPGFQTELGDNFYAGPDPNKVSPVDLNAIAPADATHVRLTGRRQYELTDHLGNVRAVVTDRKLADFSVGTGTFIKILPEIAHASNYFAFGMEMPGMNLNSNTYRYGFNGKEKEQNGEWGTLTSYDYGFRIYNPGLGKFLSVDPLTKSYPMLTPYQFATNRPIDGVDLDGLEWTSSKRWSDIIDDDGSTYADLWNEQVAVILGGYLGRNEPEDCANMVIRALIEFAECHSLPFHVEGSNTGSLRLFDNDLMEYETGEQLYLAVAAAYGASDFYNGSVFTSIKSISDIAAGDILTWDFRHGTYHAQLITERNGDWITSIMGDSPPLVYQQSYSVSYIDETGYPRESAWENDFWNGNGYFPRAYSLNFDYFDKFMTYNSMAEIDQKYSQIFDRVFSEYSDFISYDGPFNELPHGDRSAIRGAAVYELYSGKKMFGTYKYRSVGYSRDGGVINEGGFWIE